MLQEIESLLILQDKDQKLRMLKREKEAIPIERSQAENKMAHATDALAAVRLKLKESEVERKNLELQAETKRTSIGRFKTQQFETRKNEEYQALAHEITRFESDISKIEDHEIELMEAAEKLKLEVAEAEKSFNEQKQQIEKLFTLVAQKETNLTERIAALEAERLQAIEVAPEDLVGRYERIMKTKGDAAVVALAHGVCMGCHMKVTTQTIAYVKAAKVITACDQCGRILFFDE